MCLWFSKLELKFEFCEELDHEQFLWNLNTTSCVKNWTRNGSKEKQQKIWNYNKP
jgi:hypothetical protein